MYVFIYIYYMFGVDVRLPSVPQLGVCEDREDRRPHEGVLLLCQGPWFRVQGSRFRVQGPGFRVQGSGFGVQGFARRSTWPLRGPPPVEDSEFRVSSFGCRVQGAYVGWRVECFGVGAWGFGFRVWCWGFTSVGFGIWGLGLRVWILISEGKVKGSGCSEWGEGVKFRGRTETADTPPRVVEAAPFTLHPSPYTLHSSPFTLQLSPFILHPSPYTIHSAPFLTKLDGTPPRVVEVSDAPIAIIIGTKPKPQTKPDAENPPPSTQIPKL